MAAGRDRLRLRLPRTDTGPVVQPRLFPVFQCLSRMVAAPDEFPPAVLEPRRDGLACLVRRAAFALFPHGLSSAVDQRRPRLRHPAQGRAGCEPRTGALRAGDGDAGGAGHRLVPVAVPVRPLGLVVCARGLRAARPSPLSGVILLPASLHPHEGNRLVCAGCRGGERLAGVPRQARRRGTLPSRRCCGRAHGSWPLAT